MYIYIHTHVRETILYYLIKPWLHVGLHSFHFLPFMFWHPDNFEILEKATTIKVNNKNQNMLQRILDSGKTVHTTPKEGQRLQCHLSCGEFCETPRPRFRPRLCPLRLQRLQQLRFRRRLRAGLEEICKELSTTTKQNQVARNVAQGTNREDLVQCPAKVPAGRVALMMLV